MNSVYEKASMIARQFALVLEHHNTVQPGQILIDTTENVVAINPADASKEPCEK